MRNLYSQGTVISFNVFLRNPHHTALHIYIYEFYEVIKLNRKYL